MNSRRNSMIACISGLAFLIAFAASPSRAQVSPFEIRNPKLRTAEETYLRKLMDLNQSISDLKFPYSFVLSRYAGLDPKDQIGSDTRGIEFVNFHDRVVLKITGNYNAAFSSTLLTKNQRSDRVFQEVVAPVLRLLPTYFTAGDKFDDVGLEICYHVLTKTSHYEYEGKEMLAVVLDKNRALSFASLTQPEAQQESLNQSDVYLNGKPFGLALGQTEPLDLEEIGRHTPTEKQHPTDETKVPTLSKDEAVARSAWEEKSVDAIFRPSASPSVSEASSAIAPPGGRAATTANVGLAGGITTGSLSKADVDALQSQYQARLDALATEGAAKYHLVDYAPPSFVLFRGRAYLQMTLRGPEKFDQDSTSIYKRTARTFDLFLAPELKGLLAQIPQDSAIAGLDITVLDQVESHANSSASKTGASQTKSQTSEAIEFICPMNSLERFADAEITNQQLIDGSIVLVNGVRIALNLQQVE